ncbi:pPIWI_RE module domain-containing protein [Streptomyces qinglanensis]|uniref:pPIWI_RE module domain-containing protein n=1 Tax=Streptomyces qinglanensis TaxID=943816 RepID=UPI003D7179A7
MYPTIRSTAYEPDPSHGPWCEPLRVLRLGEGLHTELTRRHRETHREPDHPLRLPVRRLNTLLGAMAPGVLATGRNAGTDGTLPWLYAREDVPKAILAPLIGTWASTLAHRADDDDGEDCWPGADLEETLLTDDPESSLRLPDWEAETVDLTETVHSHGGTAEPAQRLYGLLPECVALRLAARPLQIGSTTLHFRVVSSGQGADLVSWPPQRYDRKKLTWYYSALVRVTVHTVPFSPRFRVHISTGVRRWATRLEVPPRELSGSTVLLEAPIPWAGSSPSEARRLITNALNYDRQRKELTWRRHSTAPLLPDLDIIRTYPEPEELFTAPEKWLNGRHDIAAGIVYHPSIGPHEVGPGLMPRERAELDAWVEQGLQPVLRRTGDLTRATRRNTPALLPRSSAKLGPGSRETQLAQQRRSALARVLDGRPLEVEIWWQSPETRDALLRELPELMGNPPGARLIPDKDSWQWQGDGVRIIARVRPVGALGGPLRLTGDRKRRKAVRLADAIDERCALVAEQTDPPRSGPSLVIAEIAGKDRFTADSDPKHALRLAWARQGRLTQFMNLPDDTTSTLKHRAHWTWLDAFRQLGAISPPAHRAGSGIPDDTQYVALWLVRYTRKGPTRCPARRLVAVRVRPGDDGPGGIEGWDVQRDCWVPYSQLLMSLADGTGDMGSADGAERAHTSDGAESAEQHWRQEAERQIRALLFQLRERPTLLLVSAANLRQCWTSLRNGELIRDTLAFGPAPGQRHTLYGPGLRVVLVRDANGRDEVAEWYAHDGAERIGFAGGLWGTNEADNRVFSSTANTPHTAAKLPKGLVKLVPTSEGPTAPGKTAWNPAQLEITVLGCLSEKALADTGSLRPAPDRPVDWATLAHQLRYHDDYPPLARPLPLHLARLAGQYVLPLARQEKQQVTTDPQGPDPRV